MNYEQKINELCEAFDYDMRKADMKEFSNEEYTKVDCLRQFHSAIAYGFAESYDMQDTNEFMADIEEHDRNVQLLKDIQDCLRYLHK